MNLDNPITVPMDSRYRRFFIVLFYGVCALTGVFIFMMPFPRTNSIQNISFYLAVVMAVILIAGRAYSVVVRTPLTYPFLLFFLWSCLSLIWAFNFQNTLNDVRAHLLNHLVLFFLIINFFNSKDRLHGLAWIIIASAVCFSVASIVFYYVIMDNSIVAMRLGNVLADGRFVWRKLSVDIVGTLTIPAMLFCIYLCRRTPHWRYRVLLTISAVIILVATILTQSRGTLIALIAAGTVFLIIKNRKLLPFFVLGIILVFAFSPYKNRTGSYTFLERIRVNYVYLQVVRDYPLGGIGFGIRTYFENLDGRIYMEKVPVKLKPKGAIVGPHTLFLDIMIRTGIIGFLLFLFIIVSFLRMSWQVIRKARDHVIKDMGLYIMIAFLSYFIIALAETVFWADASAMMFYILLAMMTVLWHLNQDESSARDADHQAV